jgi:hypothetical protein
MFQHSTESLGSEAVNGELQPAAQQTVSLQMETNRLLPQVQLEHDMRPTPVELDPWANISSRQSSSPKLNFGDSLDGCQQGEEDKQRTCEDVHCAVGMGLYRGWYSLVLLLYFSRIRRSSSLGYHCCG